MPQNKDKYTFVVNTYPSEGREVELARNLHSIFNQTYEHFEVLIVENYENLEIINPIIDKFITRKQPIRVISDSKKKLSYLFDIGWRNTNTELLAYVADDVELESGWLENVHNELTGGKETAVVTGPILSSCFPAGEMHRLYLISQKNLLYKVLAWPYLHFAMEDKVLLPGNLFESGAYSLGAAIPEAKGYKRQEIDLATTSSMGIRRSVLEEIDGFDQRFNFNHADGDLFIRIKKAGYKIIFTPNVVSHHHLRLGPSRNSYIIALDTGKYYRKHVRPKSINGYIGAFLNVGLLNLYWVYNTIRTGDLRQLRGIMGFLIGITKKT
ncbi:glycosyltransferase family 2 protein [Patescibacteria group bacterium]